MAILNIVKEGDPLLRKKCRPVTEETIRNEKAGTKLLGILAKFIAPLM